MASYLVTGAAGFIGSHTVEALLSRGDRVVGFDNLDSFYDPAVKLSNLFTAKASPNYQFLEGDVRDDVDLENAFALGPFDAVIHLAARAGVRPSLEQPQLYDDVNVRGTTAVLEAIRRHGVPHLVQASSSSVYGATSRAPFSESEPADRPSSPYAATKRANELSTYAHHHLYGTTVSCLRFFTVYGPRQRPEMAIHKFAQLISQGQSVPIFGDGTSTRDYTFIDDIVQGVLASLDRPNGYRIYNLGTTALTPLLELAQGIADRLELPLLVDHKPLQAGDVPTTFADISLARRELDYTPTTSVADGLDRFIEWFEARQSVALDRLSA